MSAVVLALAAAIVVIFDSNTRLFADYADGYRTEQVLKLPDAAKVWRQEAWQRDDFLAQVRLGDLYSTNQSISPGESKAPGFYDPVEAYVWYFMALRPAHDYSVTDEENAYYVIDKIRYAAENNAQEIFDSLTFEQRLDARARLLYILSNRGAEGYLALGRIHANFDAGPSSRLPPYLVCKRSVWVRWAPLRWLWSFFSWFLPVSNPHQPYWDWIAKYPDNQNLDDPIILPDNTLCVGLKVPEKPTLDQLQDVNNWQANGQAAAKGNGVVALNGGAGNNVGGNANAGGGQLYIARNGGPNVAIGDAGGAPLNARNGAANMGIGDAGGVPLINAGAGGGVPLATAGNGTGGAAPSWVFVRNDVEALVYFMIAQRLGHPLAGAYVQAERELIKYYSSDASRIIAEAEKRSRFWTPPYEYYPGITAKGRLHSDESLPSLEQRIALNRVARELPFPAVLEALEFRGYITHARFCRPVPVCVRGAIVNFQKAMGWEETSVLSSIQTVRLIQMAAVDGDAIAQNRLGVMYANGIGVTQNFVRAEYWFSKSANQRFPDALYNLYVLYMVGPNGVDPDDNKANTYKSLAMNAGFNPARCELMDLLRQSDAAGHDHPLGARR